MARGAGVRESSLNVVGCRCPGKVCTVALVTIGINNLIVAGNMARLAGNCRMFSGQREMRGVVVECRGRPCRCRVARGAIMGEVPGRMIGIRG